MGTAQLFSFVRRRAPPDWSAQDIAEFYRVEAILAQSGLQVTSARGLTDEGDPWFVFCRADDDEVIIHFARIDGRYIISSPAYCGNAAGYDFRTLVRAMIERHPVLRPKPSGDNLYLHPAALLVMLVATAFLKSGHAAEAASTNGSGGGAGAGSDAAADTKSRVAAAASGTSTAAASITLDATQETLLLSAINAAIVASVPQHTIITEATSSAAFLGPDASDQPQTTLTSAMVMDRPHDAQVAGSSGMTPTASPQYVIVALVDSTTNTPSHTAPPTDTVAVKLSSPEPLHYQPLPDTSSLASSVAPVGVTLDATAAIQHVSLSGLAYIPQTDKGLLQALGVPEMVAYTPTAPAAISTVIQGGAHTAAANTGAGSASSTEPPKPAASTNIVSETVHLPADPGSAAAQIATAPTTVPDIATVMHIVQLFQAVEVQPTVLLTGHGAIFYDAAAINSQYSAVTSVTYDFGDGFSISLVGVPAELTHAGAHM